MITHSMSSCSIEIVWIVFKEVAFLVEKRAANIFGSLQQTLACIIDPIEQVGDHEIESEGRFPAFLIDTN